MHAAFFINKFSETLDEVKAALGTEIDSSTYKGKSGPIGLLLIT